MGRFLLLLAIVVLAVWVVRRALARPPQGAPRPREGMPSAKAEGDLVSCAYCGTHLPLAEAKAAGDRVYCSDEHARLGPGRG